MSEKAQLSTTTDLQKSTITTDGGQPIEQVVGTDAEIQDKLAERIEHVEDVYAGAAAATKQEQDMTFFQALKAYPRASAFSILFSSEPKRSLSTSVLSLTLQLSLCGKTAAIIMEVRQHLSECRIFIP